MKTVDAIIDILQREKVEFLSCFPTTSVIDAAASAGMRPVICRQERVGVGIADGFARVTNGRRPAVFEWIQDAGGIADYEMWRTFNCGVGMLLVAARGTAGVLVGALEGNGEHAWVAGRIEQGEDAPEVRIE